MNSSTPQPNLPLLAFFSAVYQPLELARCKPSYCDQFQQAIRWLAALLGRRPLLGDFNRETMLRVVQRLAGVGLGELRSKTIRQVLWRLWRYAHQLGYVVEPPIVSRQP